MIFQPYSSNASTDQKLVMDLETEGSFKIYK